MLTTKRDEAKRTKLFQIVSTSAFIIVVLIVAFFLFKMFTGNPLEGTWLSEDSDLSISVKSNNTVTVNVPEVGEVTDVKVKLQYAIDKDNKMLTIKLDQAAVDKAAEASDGQYDSEMLEVALSSIITSFNYSVDGDVLTLTEREYGEQMIFTKE